MTEEATGSALSSGVPVITTDPAGATTVWYAPFTGKYVPICDGANMIPRRLTGRICIRQICP